MVLCEEFQEILENIDIYKHNVNIKFSKVDKEERISLFVDDFVFVKADEKFIIYWKNMKINIKDVEIMGK